MKPRSCEVAMMDRFLLLSILAFSLSSCLPSYYQIVFPATAVDQVPARFFAGSKEVMVVPVWHWAATSEHGVGPPVFVPTTELGGFPQRIKRWKGIRLARLFDHEGPYTPSVWGAVLIGSEGKALRLRYRLSMQGSASEKWFYYWEAEAASVGPRIQESLARGFQTGAFENVDLGLLFGLPAGKLLGEEAEIRRASEFVERLSGSGDDSWTAFARALSEGVSDT